MNARAKVIVIAVICLSIAGGYFIGINGPTFDLVDLGNANPSKIRTPTPPPTRTPSELRKHTDALCESVIVNARLGQRSSLIDIVFPDDYTTILRDCIRRLD